MRYIMRKNDYNIYQETIDYKYYYLVVPTNRIKIAIRDSILVDNEDDKSGIYDWTKAKFSSYVDASTFCNDLWLEK